MVHFFDVEDEIKEALDHCLCYDVIEDWECVVSRLAETLGISEDEADELLSDWLDWRWNILPRGYGKGVQKSLTGWLR